MTPRLPARLQAVAALVPAHAHSVADVGAGHGALSAHLVHMGVQRVIATEAAPGPLAELRRNLAAWGVTDHVEVRCGRNLDPLQGGEVEGVVVAGVSARTVIGTCEQATAKSVRWMLLQCMQGGDRIEPWLAEHGWELSGRRFALQRHHLYPTWLVMVR